VTGIDSAENKAFPAAMTKTFGAARKPPNDLAVPPDISNLQWVR